MVIEALIIGILGVGPPAVLGVADLTRDRAVIQALALHLIKRDWVSVSDHWRSKTDLVLDDSLPTAPVLYPCSSGCVEKGTQIPVWGLTALADRDGAIDYSSFRWSAICTPCIPPIRIPTNLHDALLDAADPSLGELKFMTAGSSATFERAFPSAKGWFAAYLPGYSPDGTEAIIRAWVGPSPHGSLATALLRRTGDHWAVEWCDIVHFA
jgi:hypothetical protein